MNLITTKDQLITNIKTFENYLTDGLEDEQRSIRDLIRKGKCLVAYEIGNELRFAPSRFLGYINNDLKKHLSSRDKGIIDGRETNPVISQVLKEKLLPSSELDNRYNMYCNDLGIIPSNYEKRKFWPLNLPNDFIENKLLEGEFPEGKIVERIHKSRERNSKVIMMAKHNYKTKFKKIICQVCDFDFEEKYGAIGIDFIEGHHIVPVSEMKEGHITTPDEIALLCANCHRMVHKKRPWLTMESLKLLLFKPKK